MNRAFLSHSSAQKDFVRKVYKSLGASRCILDECCFDNGKKLLMKSCAVLSILIYLLFCVQ